MQKEKKKRLLTNKQTLILKILDFRPLVGIRGYHRSLKVKVLQIQTTKQMTRGLLLQKPKFGRRAQLRLSAAALAQSKRERNKIATFAVMYHVHVNSFPVWSYAAVAIEAALHSGRKQLNLLSICFVLKRNLQTRIEKILLIFTICSLLMF